MLLQSVRAQKRDTARHVEVVLVLRWLLRLRFDQELPFEADRLGVIDREMEERAEVVLLPLEVRVEQRLVPFTAAPENVIFAAELLGDFERFFYLRGSV